MEEILNIFMSQGVDGIIVTPCVGEKVSKLFGKFSVVLINRDLPSLEGVGRVFLDNILSMKMVVDHFYNNGYRKIEMISEKIEVSS